MRCDAGGPLRPPRLSRETSSHQRCGCSYAGGKPSSPFGQYRDDLDVCRHEGDICHSHSALCHLQRSATLEGLCAPPGSPANPVTLVVGRHMLLGKFNDEEALDQTEDHQEQGVE
jgi:hypothetical protein